MKKVLFQPGVPEEIRAIDRKIALHILRSTHRYAESGEGDVKSLSGEFEGLMRLRVGDHRVLFRETSHTITIHRVRHRREAYR